MKNLSRIASDVANPFVLFTVLYVAVAFAYSEGPFGALACIALELLAAGVVAGYVFWMRRRKRVGDFWISSRAERIVPAVVLLAAFVGLLALLPVVDAPEELFYLTLSMGLAAAAVAAVTLLWKASAHGAVAGHAAVAGVLLLGGWGSPFVILLPLVLWARISSGAHTTAQALVGAGAGAVLAGVFLT